MSKISDAKAFEMYPENNMVHQYRRKSYSLGYDQSAKDTIARIRAQVNKWIPDGNEEYEIGERIAYNSMIVFLQKLEKEYE